MTVHDVILPGERLANLDRLVERAGRLYSLPAVALKVLELTDRPEVDLHALKECLENDPALAGRVLRVVNSSLLGLSRKVSDLNQALALLGVRPLKILVLGFSLPADLFADIEGPMLRRYWQRTLTKAVAARQLCEEIWNVPGEEAFLAGLLQDIGMLILIRELGEPYARLLNSALTVSHDVGAFTARSLGFDHAELSARLLAKWKLPDALVDGIRSGRPAERIDSLPADRRALPQILHLAELLSGLLGDQRTDLIPDLIVAAGRYKKITPAELQSLIGTLQQKVQELADALNLELSGGIDCAALQIEAHGRMSELTVGAVGELVAGARSGKTASADDLLLADVRSLAAEGRAAARPEAAKSEEPLVKSVPGENWLAGHKPHRSPEAHVASFAPARTPPLPLGTATASPDAELARVSMSR